MTQITLQQAGTELKRLVREAQRGEEVILTEGNRPVARLVAVTPTEAAQPRQPGTGRGQILYMADDFDAPLADFASYL